MKEELIYHHCGIFVDVSIYAIIDKLESGYHVKLYENEGGFYFDDETFSTEEEMQKYFKEVAEKLSRLAAVEEELGF